MTLTAALLAASLAAGPAPQAPSPAQPLLVVLTTTGETVDGLPVLTPHPEPQPYLEVLSRGFSGRLLRLYAHTQEFLRRTQGRTPEPAYLVLTNEVGGFPRTGFVLDGVRKPDAGWVDLRRSSAISGRYGAIDQIFPHELLHVIHMQLAGAPPHDGGNQIHALGVRSDPTMAFFEGLAEHAQVMAIDDTDATPDTQALRTDTAALARAEATLDAYAADLAGGRWPIQRQRLRFPLWYSQTEQVLRYHAVKTNQLAHTPETPPDLDLYEAYLWRSIVLPRLDAPLRPVPVQLSIDGPVAHLFWRLAIDEALQLRYLDDGFYAQFGVSRQNVSPLENVYLKMFAVLARVRPATTADLFAGWKVMLPGDADDLSRVLSAALGQPDIPQPPSIWLANEAFVTGTTIFDQYRSLPRMHTFDVNAAEVFDWQTVPGLTPESARALVDSAPYATLDDVLRHASLDAGTRDQIRAMATTMSQRSAEPRDGAESVNLATLLSGYVWRVGLLILVAALPASWLARRAGARRISTSILIGIVASLLVTLLGWTLVASWWVPIIAPMVLCGVPWAAVALLRQRTVTGPAIALCVWLVAALPAGLLTYPW